MKTEQEIEKQKQYIEKVKENKSRKKFKILYINNGMSIK